MRTAENISFCQGQNMMDILEAVIYASFANVYEEVRGTGARCVHLSIKKEHDMI